MFAVKWFLALSASHSHSSYSLAILYKLTVHPAWVLGSGFARIYTKILNINNNTFQKVYLKIKISKIKVYFIKGKHEPGRSEEDILQNDFLNSYNAVKL